MTNSLKITKSLSTFTVSTPFVAKINNYFA